MAGEFRHTPGLGGQKRVSLLDRAVEVNVLPLGRWQAGGPKEAECQEFWNRGEVGSRINHIQSMLKASCKAPLRLIWTLLGQVSIASVHSRRVVGQAVWFDAWGRPHDLGTDE